MLKTKLLSRKISGLSGIGPLGIPIVRGELRPENLSQIVGIEELKHTLPKGTSIRLPAWWLALNHSIAVENGSVKVEDIRFERPDVKDAFMERMAQAEESAKAAEEKEKDFRRKQWEWFQKYGPGYMERNFITDPYKALPYVNGPPPPWLIDEVRAGKLADPLGFLAHVDGKPWNPPSPKATPKTGPEAAEEKKPDA